MSYIKNIDCFDGFKDIKNKSVDMVLVDLPYGQTGCKWDSLIDLDKMWVELKKICKQKANYVFFCSTKFGNSLINSNPKWFRYDLVWEKLNSVGFLSANKMPLRKHEMIYVFSFSGDDLLVERNKELREYAKSVKSYINKPMKEIDRVIGNMGIHRFFNINSSQFRIPNKKNYEKLTNHYKLNEMKHFKTYDEIKSLWDNQNKKTYNPIKPKGKPYKRREQTVNLQIYGNKNLLAGDNKGTRFPTSILKYGYDKDKYHPTQKPLKLCEYLIKTYSNEGDLVLDFTMGSGSTICACINTKRRYIGFEKDKTIFKTASKRIKETLV